MSTGIADARQTYASQENGQNIRPVTENADVFTNLQRLDRSPQGDYTGPVSFTLHAGRRRL
jgi:hypothetical protein